MNLPKAIEIKEEMRSLGLAPYDETSSEADRLSIEALKRVRDNPIVANHFLRALLPGETKD